MWAPPKENDTEAYDVEKKSAPPLWTERLLKLCHRWIIPIRF